MPTRSGVSNCATTRSWKNCPPSCSATPAARRAEEAGTMSRSRGRKLMGEINVVPYIDVMLVLLIIFMVTAPMLSQGIKVDLPQASAEPIPPADLEPLLLSVDRAGAMYLNIGDPKQSLTDDK